MLVSFHFNLCMPHVDKNICYIFVFDIALYMYYKKRGQNPPFEEKAKPEGDSDDIRQQINNWILGQIEELNQLRQRAERDSAEHRQAIETLKQRLQEQSEKVCRITERAQRIS